MATKRLEFEGREQLALVAGMLHRHRLTVADLCAYLALETAEDIAESHAEDGVVDGEGEVDVAVRYAGSLLNELNPGMATNEFWDMLSLERHPLEALREWKAAHDAANAPDDSYVRMAEGTLAG